MNAQINLLLFVLTTSVGFTQNCMADFTFGPTDLTIDFSDQSASAADDPIVSWNWYFGDGSGSTQQNPTHSFPDPDNYDVCLAIQTANGCTDQLCIEIETCVLQLSVSVGDCNANNEIPLTINVSDPYDAARDINISVDAAGFLIAWSIGYYLGQGNTPVAAPHPMQSFVNCTAETTDHYTCSMHFSLEQPEPGQCPACGMKLIKKRLLPQFNPDLVALSDAELLLSGVETQIVGDPKSSRGGIPVSGRLKIPPGQIRRQVAGLPGRIEALYITAEGDYVKKGAPIASIYSKDLIAVVEAFVHNTNSESILRAAKNNLKSWNLDLEVLQQFDVASGQYRHPVTISADYEGYVLEHFTHTGDYTANAHMGAPATLYTIASLDKLWAVLEMYETQLSSIRLGRQVHLTTEAFPGERFGGTISFISPVVDPDTRTVEVRV
ncbi:MAG: efflux RND transporter periplasmic adaptor subunit [Phaeodactylibacter sp.]|uniref:efflux RND transporter periplasmic adaptor subunit n=1 Tax=Phaeodactylibacter sp. TaxID=1940289 RepID=UPI0032EEF7D5